MSTKSTTVAAARTVAAVEANKAVTHWDAFQAQAAFAASDKLKLVSNLNPWRAAAAHRFYTLVLAKAPATVGEALASAAKQGIKATEAQRHLRWLFTWPAAQQGPYLSVNGLVWQPKAPAKAPRAARKAPAKAPATVEAPAPVAAE
jgi:hypothetical protein